MGQLCEWLATAEIKVVKQVERNYVAFNNSKDDMIAFHRRRKAYQWKRLLEALKTVRKHTMKFNIEATKWLGMYLEIGLQFRKQKNISLEIVKCAEDRVRKLGSTHVLEPGLIRKVQIAADQPVALYGAKI